jgi:hypothetical protein
MATRYWASARIRSPKGNKHTITQLQKELQDEDMILTPEIMWALSLHLNYLNRFGAFELQDKEVGQILSLN